MHQPLFGMVKILWHCQTTESQFNVPPSTCVKDGLGDTPGTEEGDNASSQFREPVCGFRGLGAIYSSLLQSFPQAYTLSRLSTSPFDARAGGEE
ncbi:hypothetical protein DMENIID0001_004050 [Sergentomyia squamirostris]